MKRVRDEIVQNAPKRVKVDPGETIETAVGHNCNIDRRHTMQLQSLIALVPSVKSKLQATDDKIEVLQKCKPNMGIYLEWLKREDTYFLWGSIAEQGLMIKFEFHGGFEAEPNILDIDNPLLSFSNGFDTGNWRDVKELLLKLFGHTDSKKAQCEHDYLFAFTRTKEVLNLRVYKILEFPTLQTKNQNMRLQSVPPVFILKPLEIHRRHLEGGSGGYIMSNAFFNEDQFMFSEGKDPFNIDQCTAYSGSSSQPMVSHVLQNCGSLVMLPLPTNNDWLGFNTSFSEFFERYHVLREVSIPGKGSGSNLGKYNQLSHSFRVFMRSLIMEVGEAFGRDCCFCDFTEENIFLRRGRAAILGVKQVQYTRDQAIKNWDVIFDIIFRKVTCFPREAQSVFTLLNIATSAKLSINPNARSLYPIIVNNFAWMDALDKDHMVCDLYREFMTFVDPRRQLAIVKALPNLKDWEGKFDSNTLLSAVRVNNLSEQCRNDVNAYQAWKVDRAATLNTGSCTLAPAEALLLFNGRKYFANLRNSYSHVAEQGKKAPTPVKLPPEEVDAIVSAALGDVGPVVQQQVPLSFGKNDPRRSYERFGRYFRCVNKAEFDPNDEK